ncbi:MAG TPA: carboxypeptidase-like regulatory domain-containing protein [Blastocatellia bacterium]|nr:carboxypeptidase-like regulatory domain-containing protein [Blastocatellia bacterium]
MRCVLTLLLALVLLAADVSARAQTAPPAQVETGTIRGTVVDPNGAVIAGADIRATLNPAGTGFTAKSDDAGAFAITNLPFGDYSVLINALGFAKFYTQVTLTRESSGSPHRASLQVTVGEVQINARMITGESVTMCAICGYTYFSIPYADLPFVDRDPQTLVALQQGVTEHAGSFSIGGRRTQNKTALLDGVDNRDPATGRFIASLSLDAVSDFNIDYTNADTTVGSSYGQNSAPLLEAASKSGTNDYHGQGLWNGGRSALSANNFFTNRGGLPRDRTKFDEAVLALGGPISLPGVFSGKDHAFFFTSFEHTRDSRTTGRQIIAPLSAFIGRTSAIQGNLFRNLLSQNRIPLASGNGLRDVDGDGLNDIGDVPIRSSLYASRNLGLMRADLNLTQLHRLSLRYYHDQSSRRNDFNDSHFTPASPLDAFHRGELISLELTSLIDAATVNDFQAGYIRGRTFLSGAGSDAPQLVALNTPLGVAAGVPELPEQRENRSFILSDTFRRVSGAHSLGAGAQMIRRSERYATEGLARGRIYYSDVLALVTDGARSMGDPTRAIVRAELAESGPAERYRFTDLYAFANDNWRASTRLALNFGAGYNIYSGAIYERPTDRNNFAPFASFAYAPTHSESVILRGGAAILFAPPTRLPYGEIKTTPLYPAAIGFGSPGEIAGSPLPGGWVHRDGAVEIEREYARDLRTAYTESAFFAVQQSIRERLIIEVGYNSTYGRRLTRAYRTGLSFVGSQPGSLPDEETTLIASDGNSSYHALQVRVTSRERRRLTFQAHYTFSKAIDTASDDRPSMFRSLALGPVFENNAGLERGPSDFDRRHRVVGFFLFRGPALDSSKEVWRSVFGDWQVSGIITMQSGPRVSLYSSGDFYGGLGDFNRDGVLNDRLAYIGGNRLISHTSPADGYFSADLYGAPGVTSRQSLGRNILPSPGYAAVDLSLKKKISLTESHQIELRADVFNVANRVNFLPPVTDLVSADFGRSIEAAAGRIVRLAVKYRF